MFVGNTVWLPESDLEPLHPFVAEHEVALLDDQVSTELFPWLITPGFAEIETVGRFLCTFTVTLSVATPPVTPVQVSVYVCWFERLPVDCEPEVPNHPFGDTEQLAAFEDVQLIVAELFSEIVIDESLPFALMSAVGPTEVTVTVTLSDACPALFEQVIVYVVV